MPRLVLAKARKPPRPLNLLSSKFVAIKILYNLLVWNSIIMFLPNVVVNFIYQIYSVCYLERYRECILSVCAIKTHFFSLLCVIESHFHCPLEKNSFPHSPNRLQKQLHSTSHWAYSLFVLKPFQLTAFENNFQNVIWTNILKYSQKPWLIKVRWVGRTDYLWTLTFWESDM